jgi:4-hydroxy-tetrahydrodipicolinate synthase
MASELPSGSLAAVLTPLTNRSEVDHIALHSLITTIAATGVTGVLVLGSSGEVASLSPAARRAVVETATDAAPSGVAVLVGVANQSQSGALDDLDMIAASSAAAALVAPPFYVPLDQAAVARFYEAAADRVDLPLLGYHIPAFTGIRLEPGTVRGLAVDGVLSGVKDSNRDLEYFQQIIAIGREIDTPWATYIGTDSLLFPALLLGATGGITTVASVLPEWTAYLVDMVRKGDYASASVAQAELTNLILTLRRGVFPAGAKAALSILGLAGPDMMAPARALDDKEIEQLKNDLKRNGVPVDASEGARA